MEAHPIESIMQNTMDNMKNMVDVNTVFGDSVVMADGTIIIPVSKVNFGFLSGGGEYGDNKQDRWPFSGGTGAGVAITPVAFLIVKDSKVQLVSVSDNSPYERILTMLPNVLDEIKGFIDRKS